MALSADAVRHYAGNLEKSTSIGIKANFTVHDGAVLCSEADGLVRPHAGGLTSPKFEGFAFGSAAANATSGIARVDVMRKGEVWLPAITGADSVNDANADVYASDDGTFTLTASGNMAIGTIVNHTTADGFLVAFEAASKRSI